MLDKLLEAARTAEAIVRESDEYGQRYETRFMMIGPNGQTKEVMAAWIIKDGEDFPRMTTCFPPAEKKQ